MTERIHYRNSVLINKAYQKLVLPDISARLCGMLVTLADSLIAARWIGISAVSAIALVAPILLFEQCLHDFFVSGTTQVLIRYKSRGQQAQANRAFGVILADVFLWYLLIWGLSLIWMKNVLHLFTQNEELIEDSFLYFIPMAVCYPICEAGLCLERGFKTDGRNGFFGARAVITNILNIVFSIVAIQVFHGGILGISIASNIASLLGYFWSSSHFFSKQCTIRPDFSALVNWKEARGYLKEERAIGSVYALDDGLYAGAAALLNKAFLLTGGTTALAAVGVAQAVTNIFSSVNGAIQSSEFSLCGLFYSDHDYRGTVYSLKTAVFVETGFNVTAWILVNLFSQQIGNLYNVQAAEIMAALKLCLAFSTLVIIGDGYTNLFSSFMLATERTKMAGAFAVAHNVMIFLSALLGFAGISFTGLLIVCTLSSALVALTEALLLIKSGKVLHEVNQEEITSGSYVLSEDTCAEISESVAVALSSVPTLSNSTAEKAALLSEEWSRLVLFINRKQKNEIRADLRITANRKECVITLIDTGKIFDSIYCLKKDDLPDEYRFSREILLGFSPKATFARVVNLNISHLILPLDFLEQQSRTANKEVLHG